MASIESTSISTRFLRVHTVASLLGVPTRTVRDWAEKGRITAVKSGPRIWLIPATDVELVWQELQTYGRLRRRPPRVQREAVRRGSSSVAMEGERHA